MTDLDVHRTLFRDGMSQMEPFDAREPEGAVRLHLNEGLPFAPEIAEAVSKQVQDLLESERGIHLYSRVSPDGFTKAYADFLGVGPENVEITSGASESILLLSIATFLSGRTIAIPQPTYYLFDKCAKLFGAREVYYPMPLPFEERQEEMRRALFSKEVLSSEIAIFCSPNNPTGSVLPESWLDEFLLAHRGVVIIDEAYEEYAEHEGYRSAVGRTASNPNLIVLRTMSKAWGAAGLRAGAVVAHPEVIYNLAKVRTYRMSSITHRLGEWLLRTHEKTMRERVAETFRVKQALSQALAELPHVVEFPTHTNFSLFRPPHANELAAHLLEKHGFAVRALSGGDVDGVLRVSTPAAEHLPRLVAGLRSFQR